MHHAGGQSLGGDVELCLNRPRVVALTGHGRGGCTHIGIVFIGHRVIGSSGQGLSSVLHGNSRLDGAAGVGLGRDRLYHIGSQSLGIHGNFLLSGFGDITLGIADCDLFVIYSQGINRGKLEVGRLHIFSAAIIVRSSDHHSRLVELLTRGISRMRAGLNGNAGQGLLGRGGECLGQREMRRIGSDNFVALSRGCVVQRFRKILTISCGHSQFCCVNLLRRSLASHRGAGCRRALEPLDLGNGVSVRITGRTSSSQILPLYRRFHGSGDSSQGRFEDDNLLLTKTNIKRIIVFITDCQIVIILKCDDPFPKRGCILDLKSNLQQFEGCTFRTCIKPKCTRLTRIRCILRKSICNRMRHILEVIRHFNVETNSHRLLLGSTLQGDCKGYIFPSLHCCL